MALRQNAKEKSKTSPIIEESNREAALNGGDLTPLFSILIPLRSLLFVVKILGLN